jgi:hypothetical protein
MLNEHTLGTILRMVQSSISTQIQFQADYDIFIHVPSKRIPDDAFATGLARGKIIMEIFSSP